MELNSGSVASSDSDAVVVSPLYFAPHFTKKAPGVRSGHLVVVDAYGRFMYRVEGHHSWTIRDRMLLLDADGHTILLLQSQKLARSLRCVQGETVGMQMTCCSASGKASKHEVHVSLASNHKSHSVDFKVSGNLKTRTIGVYKGESTQMVAEMSQEQISSSMPADKKAFGVAVSQNVDSCFIAALFAVLPQIYASSAKSASKASKKSGDKKASKKSGSNNSSKKSGSEEDSETSESEDDSAKKASQDGRESGSSKVETAAAGVEVAGGMIEVLAAVFEAFSS